MAHIGYGALMGGSLGALLKTGEIAIPTAAKGATGAAEATRNALVGAPGEEVGPLGRAFATASSKLSDQTPEEIMQALQQRGQGQGQSSWSDIFTSLAFGHMGGGAFGAAREIGKSLMEPEIAISRLGNIERVAQSATNKIMSASDAIYSVVSPAAYKSFGIAGAEMTKEDQESQYQKRVKQIEEDSAPERLMDKTDWVTRDMYHVAPNIGAALQMTMMRGNQFLSTKIPKPMTALKPMDPPFKPTMPQMIKFNRYYDAVHRPLSLIDYMRDGQINKEAIEAVSNVYPKLYSEIKTEAMDGLSTAIAKEQPIPYQKRLAIAAVLGQAVDSSLEPGAVQANQALLSARQMAKKAQEGAVKTTSKGLGNVTLSDRLKTNIQESAQRERA